MGLGAAAFGAVAFRAVVLGAADFGAAALGAVVAGVVGFTTGGGEGSSSWANSVVAVNIAAVQSMTPATLVVIRMIWLSVDFSLATTPSGKQFCSGASRYGSVPFGRPQQFYVAGRPLALPQ